MGHANPSALASAHTAYHPSLLLRSFEEAKEEPSKALSGWQSSVAYLTFSLLESRAVQHRKSGHSVNLLARLVFLSCYCCPMAPCCSQGTKEAHCHFSLLESRAESGDLPNLSDALSGDRNLPASHAHCVEHFFLCFSLCTRTQSHFHRKHWNPGLIILGSLSLAIIFHIFYLFRSDNGTRLLPWGARPSAAWGEAP